jgi:cytochrome c peroxidase
VPSPHLENGKLSKKAKSGEKVFEKAGCAVCHPSGLLTDLKQHDLGTSKGLDQGKPQDTPTLVEVWRTAPYLHDGRAATLMDMFTKHNANEKHGRTAKLSKEELEDLCEFVLSH